MEDFQKATGSLGVGFDIGGRLLLVGLQKAVDVPVRPREHVTSGHPHYLGDLRQWDAHMHGYLRV